MFGAAVGDGDVPPALTRPEGDEEVRRPFTAVVVVIATALPRFGGDGLPDFTDQLKRTFVETDHRIVTVVGFGIQVENILHPRHKRPVHARDAPLRLLPGLQVVFFR